MELTKKDVKEAVVEAFTPFADAIQQDFKKVHGGLAVVNERLGSVEREVKEMKESASELFGKLDEFISLYQKQQEEMTSLIAQVQRLDKRVTKLEE